MCVKSFHALCANYHDLNDGDFAEKSDLFLCTRCFNLSEAIGSNIQTKIAQFIKEKILVNTNSCIKVTCEIGTQTANSDSHVSNNINSSCEPSPLSPLYANSSNSTEPVSVSMHNNNIKTTDKALNIENVINNVEDKNNWAVVGPSKKTNARTAYLCHVDAEFTIDDIASILELEDVPTAHTTISDAPGNFKKYKYVKLTWPDNVNYFKFYNSLSTSSLASKWFISQSPPKLKQPKIEKNIASERNQTLQRSANATNIYTNTNRSYLSNTSRSSTSNNNSNSYRHNSYHTQNKNNINNTSYKSRTNNINYSNQNSKINKCDFNDQGKGVNNSQEKKSNIVSFLEDLIHAAKAV